MTEAKKKEIKKILKNHSVKGFRKAKLKTPTYFIGKQCQRITHAWTAHSLIDSLKNEGFIIKGESVARSLADKGLLDTLTITI